MKYEPDLYIIKIHERKDTYRERLHGAPLFDTWEDAWTWLHNYRRKTLEQAKKTLAAEERAYKRVFAIKPANMVDRPLRLKPQPV